MKRPFFVWLGHFYSLGVISRWAVAPVLIGSQSPNIITKKTAANAVRLIYMGIPHTSGCQKRCRGRFGSVGILFWPSPWRDLPKVSYPSPTFAFRESLITLMDLAITQSRNALEHGLLPSCSISMIRKKVKWNFFLILFDHFVFSDAPFFS